MGTFTYPVAITADDDRCWGNGEQCEWLSRHPRAQCLIFAEYIDEPEDGGEYERCQACLDAEAASEDRSEQDA